MYIYIYIYIYTRQNFPKSLILSVYVFVCVCSYIYTHTHTHIHTYACCSSEFVSSGAILKPLFLKGLYKVALLLRPRLLFFLKAPFFLRRRFFLRRHRCTPDIQHSIFNIQYSMLRIPCAILKHTDTRTHRDTQRHTCK